MTTWSGFVNHLAIGYDVWTDAYDSFTPSINVYIQISVKCDPSFNFNDSETAVLSGSASGSWTFQNTLQANGVVAVGSATIPNQGQSYGGGPAYSFHAQLNGVYLGAGPAIDFSYTLPARPIRVPNAPGTPSFSAVLATTATMNWTGSTDNGGSGVDAYHLQVDNDATFASPILSFNSNSGAGLTGLSPGTKYYGRVQAHNGAGWGGYSAAGSFTTNTYQLAAPTLTTTSPTSMHVAWGSPPTADTPTGWDLQVATSSDFSSIVKTASGATWGTSTDITGLSPGTNYFVRVRAHTASGFGAFSPTASLKTLTGAKVMRNGSWVDAPAYVYRGGSWVSCTVYKYRGGTWNL